MQKLSNKNISWLVKLKQRQKNGELYLTKKQISGQFGITVRRVQQIWNTFIRTGKVPKLHKPGPSCQPLSEDERRLVMKAYRLCNSGAKVLEEIIFVMEGAKVIRNNTMNLLIEFLIITFSPLYLQSSHLSKEGLLPLHSGASKIPLSPTYNHRLY